MLADAPDGMPDTLDGVAAGEALDDVPAEGAVGGGALDRCVAGGRLLDAVVAAGGAVVALAGLGGTLEALRLMAELPLLWYPSVARIM